MKPEITAELSAQHMKHELFKDIHFVNFMVESRKRSFQMIGIYDGAISEQCKSSFQESYKFWDRMLFEAKAAEYQESKGESND